MSAPVDALAAVLGLDTAHARAVLIDLDRSGWRLDRRPPGPGFDDDARCLPSRQMGDLPALVGLDVPTADQIALAQLWAPRRQCASVHAEAKGKARSWRCSLTAGHAGTHHSIPGHRKWPQEAHR